MIKQLVLQQLASRINQLLRLDPEFFARLQEHRDKVVEITIIGLPLSWYMQIAEHELLFFAQYQGSIDTVIRGKPFSLLHIYWASDKPVSLFDKDVEITGNMQLAEQLLHVLRDYEIDWQEFLALALGDSAAHFIGQGIRATINFAKQSKDAISENLSAYLHDECKLLPTSIELEQFYRNVDTLRDDIARLQARVNQCMANEQHE